MNAQRKNIALSTLLTIFIAYFFTSNTSEFLSALQTIVLVLTAIIVYWYTLETQKIREATLQQNQIMGDQLRVMQESSSFQSQKEKNLAQPIFQPAGYDCALNEANIKFKNLGATVKNLLVEVTPPCEVTCYPPNVGINEQLTVHLKKLQGSSADFELKIFFDDQFNHRGSKTFIWQRDRGSREVR